jgi:hypothetical protein
MTSVKGPSGNRPVQGVGGVEAPAAGAPAGKPTELDALSGEVRTQTVRYLANGNVAAAAELLRRNGAERLAATIERTDDGAVSLFAKAALRTA